MPRAFVATPASALKDNVASLLSRPVSNDIESSWQSQEAARRQEEYSAELRAQIAAKEAARQLEQVRRSAAGEHAGLPEVESAAAHDGASTDANVALPAIRAAVPPPIAPSLPLCPSLTEKERFIAAMERGITLSPKSVRRRSVTAPAPASAAATAALQHRPGSAGGDEAALRALQFKLELDLQIEEKKRLKALERERERQWEAEQEERLERERAQLRQQFEEEHAARRAKVAADQASGASKGGPGIQIYAPKRKPGRAAGAAGAAAVEARKGSSPGSEASQRRPNATEVGARKDAPEKPEAPSEVAPAASDSTEPPAAPPPAICTVESYGISEKPSDPAAMAAACAQLASQVAELRRLNEAVRRELSLHKAALDASNGIDLAAATTLMTLSQVPGGSGGSSGSGGAASTFPILHSTAELRIEDSRPSSSRMPLQTRHRGGPALAATRSKLGGCPAPWPIIPPSPSPLRGAHRPPILAETVAEKVDNLRLAESVASEPSMLIAAVPAGTPRPAPPALASAKLVPVWRSERMAFWKSAGKKLRKLTVTRAAGGADGRWVEQEDSRSSAGAGQ